MAALPRAFLFGIALAPLLAAAPAAAAGVLEVEPRADDDYGESFTFIADLDDRTYLQMQLGVTNLGPGSGHGLCSMMVKRTGSAGFTANDHVSRDGWSWVGSEGKERLSVSTCEAAIEGGRTTVKMALGEAKVSLTFLSQPTADPLAPGNVDTGGRWLRTWVLYWSAPVEATLSLPGQKPVTVAGGGYADHSRSIAVPQEVARTWVRFRSVRDGAGQMVLLGRVPRGGKPPPVWLRVGKREPLLFSDMDLKRGGAKARPEWEAKLAGPQTAELSSVELLYRFDPLAELGPLGSIVSAFVNAPITYFYRGTLKLGEAPGVEGVMEVEVFEDG